MNNLRPLMQREWLQHRNGWALLLLVPLGLALVLTAVGEVQLDGDTVAKVGSALPAMLALGAIVASTALLFFIAWIGSLIIVSGLARRDHGDRSIEFWLSLPISHSESLGVPLLVHLLLVPAAALLAGLAGGYLLALVLVGHILGLQAWATLPWGQIVPASLVLMLRLLAGLPLATLWLAPLILLIVLMTAWFRRWSWVILTVGLGLGSYLLKLVFGQPLLNETVKQLLKHAARALVPDMGDKPFVIHGPADVLNAFSSIPSWLARDFLAAVGDLASPLMLGGLLFAAGCFWLLVQWRQRAGASAGA
jgi:ABC-2 type transport system permease protein